MADDENTEICLTCGLCCQGQLYSSVALQPGEVERAKTWLVELIQIDEKVHFTQPCACYRDQRCTVYPDRPQVCVNYKCLLLERLQDGSVSYTEAQDTIRRARSLVADIEKQINPGMNKRIWERIAKKWDFADIRVLLENKAISEDLLMSIVALGFLLDRKFRRP